MSTTPTTATQPANITTGMLINFDAEKGVRSTYTDSVAHTMADSLVTGTHRVVKITPTQGPCYSGMRNATTRRYVVELDNGRSTEVSSRRRLMVVVTDGCWGQSDTEAASVAQSDLFLLTPGESGSTRQDDAEVVEACKEAASADWSQIDAAIVVRPPTVLAAIAVAHNVDSLAVLATKSVRPETRQAARNRLEELQVARNRFEEAEVAQMEAVIAERDRSRSAAELVLNQAAVVLSDARRAYREAAERHNETVEAVSDAVLELHRYRRAAEAR